MVAIEAGSFGKPVLLTDRCGFDEVADVGGGMVVPATKEALGKALSALLAKRENLSEMGARLQSQVAAHYTWPALVRRLIQYLRKNVDKPGS